MGSDFIKTCELCGEDFACRSRNARYCPKCREEIKRVDALNRYYIKRGVDKRVELNIKPTPKASTGKKNGCGLIKRQFARITTAPLKAATDLVCSILSTKTEPQPAPVLGL